MNRRNFLKVLGAAGLAVAVPVALVPSKGNPLLPGRVDSYEDFIVKRIGPVMHDYETQTGIGVAFYRGEERWRHAIRLPTAAWKEFTAEQQEETWKRVERRTYELTKPA
jgi:hypothetical protein